jgi:glycosyltransferase involved in cell wall biosynthesis
VPFPVSVIVPHLPSRRQFLNRFCLPSVRANEPLEIIVEEDAPPFGNGNALRNRGAKKAKGEFVAFVDDDVVLAADYLALLCRALLENPSSAYAYCDSLEVCFPGTPPVYSGGKVQRPGDFDPRRLCQGNYISTMSLMRRASFPGFDPDIRRLQDWDLWLTLLGRGERGTYVGQTLFWNCHIDEGITARESKENVVERIRRKHDGVMKKWLK